jgi:tRNA threonylcarbamoyladenosine biosynthesis protein TsaE
MRFEVNSEQETRLLGERIGRLIQGGQVIELIGDVGSGKTTLTKGISVGLDIKDDVQSPSYTINRTYDARDSLVMSHYDFYRLTDAGILKNELEEVFGDDGTIVIIEWADIVDGVLPEDRLTVEIIANGESTRLINLLASGYSSKTLLKGLINDTSS